MELSVFALPTRTGYATLLSFEIFRDNHLRFQEKVYLPGKCTRRRREEKGVRRWNRSVDGSALYGHMQRKRYCMYVQHKKYLYECDSVMTQTLSLSRDENTVPVMQVYNVERKGILLNNKRNRKGACYSSVWSLLT